MRSGQELLNPDCDFTFFYLNDPFAFEAIAFTSYSVNADYIHTTLSAATLAVSECLYFCS